MKKAGCIILAVAMLLGVASCNKRGDDLSKAKKVPDNGTWWNDTITEISGEELWKEFDNKAFQVFNKYLYADEESVILCFSASINKPGDEYYRESFLRHYSYDGKLLGQVNIGDSFAEGTEYAYKASIYKQNGKYYTFADIYDNEKENYGCYCYEIDFEGGVLKDPFVLNVPSEDRRPSTLGTITDIGDKLVAVREFQNSDFTFSFEICIIDGDNVKSFAPDFGYYSKVEYIEYLMRYGDLVSFVANVTENGMEKTMFCTLDPETLEFDSVEMDYYASDYQFVPGCGVFDMGDNRSVKKLDPFTGEEETVLDLSGTYVNGQCTYESELVLVTDDKVVIHEREPWRSPYIDTSKLCLLEKAGADPNAGKALLSVAPLLEMTSQEYYAINDFNRNSDKYFISVDYKYYDAMMKYEETEEDSAYPDYGIINTCAAEAVDLLMSDIREGSGPDMVIYDSSSAQLNNTGYLTDLTKRIGSEKDLAGGDYMEYILEPNGWDGNHYRLDYGFCFDGVIIKSSLIDSGSQGLTFEQYENVINEHNGGVNNFAFDDLSMMYTLISCSDYFAYDKSGRFSIDREGFKKLADYIASVPDGSYDVDCRENDPLHELPEGYFGAYESYSFMGGYDDFSVIGKPSPDGHPETVSGRGIGITDCCVLQDAAWSFVMKMLSPEVQLMAGQYDYDPVLKSAMRTNNEEYIGQHNALCALSPKSYGMIPVPENLLDRYIDQISDAVMIPDVDSSVLVIFYEEMPAYFEGQKSFDDVVSIIENRVNLMLSERG